MEGNPFECKMQERCGKGECMLIINIIDFILTIRYSKIYDPFCFKRICVHIKPNGRRVLIFTEICTTVTRDDHGLLCVIQWNSHI